ncbi:hypothetical protein K9L27_03695 [Candidatus Gracilibacteria bacterium]|nr:hypothetical protein [Candidatus Gracilibacteria bacterium]
MSKKLYLLFFIIAVIAFFFFFDRTPDYVRPTKVEEFTHHPWMRETFGPIQVDPEQKEKNGRKFFQFKQYFFVPGDHSKYREEFAFIVLADSLDNIIVSSIYSVKHESWSENNEYPPTGGRSIMLGFLNNVGCVNSNTVNSGIYTRVESYIDSTIHKNKTEIKDPVLGDKTGYGWTPKEGYFLGFTKDSIIQKIACEVPDSTKPKQLTFYVDSYTENSAQILKEYKYKSCIDIIVVYK